VLDGWLDNRPVDNPKSGGVLALSPLTGPVKMSGGFISGGTITSTGTGALDEIDFEGPLGLSDGYLDSVTNDGTISAFSSLWAEGSVVNNGTLTADGSGGGMDFLPEGSFTNNGTMTVSSGGDFFESPVTNNGTITVTNGTFGVSSPGAAVNLANNSSISLSSSATFYVTGSMVNSGTVNAITHSDTEFEGN
jgi:hypothetical protein